MLIYSRIILSYKLFKVLTLAYLPLMLRLFLISMSSHRAHSGLFPQIPHSPPKSTAIWQHWWDLDSMTLKMVSQVGKKDNGSFQEYLNWVARNYCHLSKFINKILLLMFQCLFLYCMLFCQTHKPWYKKIWSNIYHISTVYSCVLLSGTFLALDNSQSLKIFNEKGIVPSPGIMVFHPPDNRRTAQPVESITLTLILTVAPASGYYKKRTLLLQ